MSRVINSFINGSTALCWALASSSVSSSFFTQTVGLLGRRTSPSQGRYLHIELTHTQTSMLWMGFEHTIPVFEWAKTVHALDHAATVIGSLRRCRPKFKQEQLPYAYASGSKDLEFNVSLTRHWIKISSFSVSDHALYTKTFLPLLIELKSRCAPEICLGHDDENMKLFLWLPSLPRGI
jgi:hypothetical protein